MSDATTHSNTKTNGGVVDSAKAAATAMAEQAKTVQKSVAEGAQVASEDTIEAVMEAGQSAKRFAKEQPLMAVGGALAVGVIIGLAINQRR